MMKTTSWESLRSLLIILGQDNKLFGLTRQRALEGDKNELVPEACGKSSVFLVKWKQRIREGQRKNDLIKEGKKINLEKTRHIEA